MPSRQLVRKFLAEDAGVAECPTCLEKDFADACAGLLFFSWFGLTSFVPQVSSW